MADKFYCKLLKVFENVTTVDEVYEAAEEACTECGNSYHRCTGYRMCRMFAALDGKLDAIEACRNEVVLTVVDASGNEVS